jgi:two-component system, response regulator YesN
MLTLVIVEDERIIRQGLIYTIDWTSLGITIVGEASNGEEGLKRIKEVKPDIVLTDIKMPVMDGIQMLEEAADFHECEKLILTSYSDFSYAQKGIRLGVYDYILKPVDDRILHETFQKLTKKMIDQQKDKQKTQTISYYQELLDKDLSHHSNHYVTQCVSFIKEHYQEKLSNEDISESLSVSTSYLSRVFKKETNLTIMDYLNRYRIMKAISLLQTENYRIYEIANDVGFSDYKHFSTVFKKYFSTSPGDFMARGKTR